MAIPFAIPNQEVSQPNLEELLRELCDILQRLLIIYQSPANNQPSRVRATASSTNNNNNNRRTTIASDQEDRIPELVTNLSLLSAAFYTRTEPGAAISIPNACTSSRLRHRQRTISESSCCEEPKNNHTQTTADEAPNQEWLQVGVELRKIADDFKSTGYKEEEGVQQKASPSKSSRQDSLFSKFVPAPFTGSICTAVICVVGWHLLRNR